MFMGFLIWKLWKLHRRYKAKFNPLTIFALKKKLINWYWIRIVIQARIYLQSMEDLYNTVRKQDLGGSKSIIGFNTI